MEVTEGFSDLPTQALRLVRAAKLPHPKGPLLESFITEAADHDKAARYLLDRLPPEHVTNSGRDASVAACLLAVCSEWSKLVANFVHDGSGPLLRDPRYVPAITRRDGGTCRLSGLGDSWRDRLAVYPILPPFGGRRVEVDPTLHELLAAFLGSNLTAWVLSGCPDLSPPFGSHWLVRASAAAAFAEGFWSLIARPTTRWEVSTCSKYIVSPTGIDRLSEPAIVQSTKAGLDLRLFDESGRGIEVPDERALELTARFSTPIRWTWMSKMVQQRQGRSHIRRICAALSRLPSRIFSAVWAPFSRALWSIWRLAPSRTRIQAYTALYRIGGFMYGSTGRKVQRLPFGLFVKYCSLSINGPLINKYDALQLIQVHSDLVVPRPLDFVSDSKQSYMVTSRIPGHTLGEMLSRMTDEELDDLMSDLNKFLSKLRAIFKGARPRSVLDTAVTGAAGGGCHHVRMELITGKRTPYGPFATEEEFHDFILTRRPPAPDEVQEGGHYIVLTHGDLSTRNIIVDSDGRLAGVVDWEHAGWYPSYWEYTSFLFDLDSLYTSQRLVDMAEGMFRGFGNFERELAVERRLWARLF